MIYLGNCASKAIANIATKCKKRLNKRWFNNKIKKEFPGIYKDLALNFYNPYCYYQNEKYYVLRHSAIEYVFEKEEGDL